MLGIAVSAIILLWREMGEYTRRRHAFLMSDKHIKTPQATTILVTAIPKGLNTEEAMFNIFNRFPGGVAKVWLNRYVSSQDPFQRHGRLDIIVNQS